MFDCAAVLCAAELRPVGCTLYLIVFVELRLDHTIEWFEDNSIFAIDGADAVVMPERFKIPAYRDGFD